MAVKRDAHRAEAARSSMADTVHAGDLLQVSAPRNNFALHPRATSHLFIAGGIGITPILAMVRHLLAQEQPVPADLLHPGRCRHRVRRGACRRRSSAGACSIHHDHGDPAQGVRLLAGVRDPGQGPCVLLRAARPDGRGGRHDRPLAHRAIHFESFGVDAAAFAANTAFSVRLQRSRVRRWRWLATQSILEALRACGHRVPSSCESGTCGSCRTGLLPGDAEHRDMVLNEDERASQIMVCVSRARSAELVLDL
jgi:phthalate 4,5-dioxygenase reductase subunit